MRATSMHCHDTTCTLPSRWRLTDATRPGLRVLTCAAHLLPLLTSSTTHVLTPVDGQPA